MFIEMLLTSLAIIININTFGTQVLSKFCLSREVNIPKTPKKCSYGV